MLKLKQDRGSDYLDYLKPFIKHILSGIREQEPVSDIDIANGLREKHGLEIPIKVVQLVLKRLAREGVIFKENHVYFIKTKIDVPDWVSKKAEAVRNIDFIASSLVDFSKNYLGKDIDEQYAIDSFILFLSRFSIPCLKNFLRNTALPNIPSNGDSRIVLVSEFIKYIEQTSPEKFDAFMILAQGHMLANALLCPDLSSLQSNYKNVTFFFDTAVLLSVLGLNGPEKQAAIKELMSLVKHLGGSLAYFSHTLVELKIVIEKAANFVDVPRGRGSIIFWARKTEKTRSDLLLALEKAEDTLLSIGLNCIDTPKYIEQHQIDESVFGNILDGEISYLNPKAKEHDINSLRSIFVLRGGTAPRSLEKCKAIFVTSNSLFANASHEYCANNETPADVSPVITDFSLINISWLKAPMGAPTLPKKEVLSFAYAALVPSRVFWDKVIDEVEKLTNDGEISERDHQLLRSSTAALSDLIKLTLGDDEGLSSVSIKETLYRVTTEIKQEELKKTSAVEDEKNALIKELKDARDENDRIKEAIYWRVDKRVRREAAIISALVAILILIVTSLSIFRSDILNVKIRYLSYALSMFLSISSYFFSFKDKSLRTLYYNKMFEKSLKVEYDRHGITLDS